MRDVISEVKERLDPLREERLLATCTMVDLEVLYSAHATDWETVRTYRASAYVPVALDQATFDRAVEVQGLLARESQHRLPIPDLVIAAAAESAGLSVLHYDADFERIAEVTGQRTEWVVPRGSV